MGVISNIKETINALVFLLLLALPGGVEAQHRHGFLYELMKKDTSALMAKVLDNPEKYKLQIVYTQIDREGEEITKLTTYTYGLQHSHYYYPASLVKLPAAALALEKLNQMGLPEVDKNAILLTPPGSSGYGADTLSYPSLASTIQQMLVMSDNPAFNRVYDFLGPDYIQLKLLQKGYPQCRVIQRLSKGDPIDHKTTGPIQLLRLQDSTKTVLYEEEKWVCPKWFSVPLKDATAGKGYMDRRLINKPKDFSHSNYLPLLDVHKMLLSILFPDQVPPGARFDLTNEDYAFLKRQMGMWPREATMNNWTNDSVFYDTYRKFLMVGTNHKRMPEYLRIYNKVGLAYGFVSDCAYIVDYKNQMDFMLSAVIYVNEDEILNDGKYEYDKIGLPFMTRLGKLVYEYDFFRTRETCGKLVPPSFIEP